MSQSWYNFRYAWGILCIVYTVIRTGTMCIYQATCMDMPIYTYVTHLSIETVWVETANIFTDRHGVQTCADCTGIGQPEGVVL